MGFHVDAGWLVAVFLIATRIAPLFFATPGFGSISLPGSVRALLVVGLSAWLVALTGIPAGPVPRDIVGVGVAMLQELVVGALIAFGLSAAFAAFMFAGRAVELQMGIGIASAFDATFRSPTPVIGNALELCAVVIFFLVDGHHLLLRTVVASLEAMPVGTPPGADTLALAIAHFGVTFTLGLAIAGPVIAVVFLLDVGLAVMARAMPQVNVFVLSFVLKVGLGLSALALTVKNLGPVWERVMGSVLLYWTRVLALHG